MIRTLLLLAILGFGAAATPMPWAALWLGVPLVVAISLLVCWRWGLGASYCRSPRSSWWWRCRTDGDLGMVDPCGSLTGSWMGLREGGGAGRGRASVDDAPVLLLAASLPWTLTYPRLVGHVDDEWQGWDRDLMQSAREVGYQGERLHTVERFVTDSATVRHRLLPHILPTILFGWIAMLVMAGRKIAAQLARRMSWPDLSRARVLDWRLPDGAVWLLIAGLALVLLDLPGWLPSASRC